MPDVALDAHIDARADAPNDTTRDARSPIDHFIFEQLTTRRLAPSPQADAETLHRRLSLDLVGLPPTLDEQFGLRDRIASGEVDAIERAIDRLLASPQFGHRWGRHWLDVAHYADSTGFETDAPRSIWKYRDWVISALNADLPFDQFVVKQLAGDLLPGATTADRTATGFLLNSPQDGGSEPARLDAVVDRVNTLGVAFLGLSLACAQCHSHKFDPLSQREYYELFALINSADETTLEFAPPAEIARRDALNSQLAALVAERDAYQAKRPPAAATPETNDATRAIALAAFEEGLKTRNRTIDELKTKVPQLVSTPVLTKHNGGRVTTTFVRGEF
ncbi:MAG TPA: DUF1549 domain-containing protein, partial [Pirellulaceae bacterium]|nr:DUF1549 domain-containing protein [Pirellulaceae bacterium]